MIHTAQDMADDPYRQILTELGVRRTRRLACVREELVTSVRVHLLNLHPPGLGPLTRGLQGRDRSLHNLFGELHPRQDYPTRVIHKEYVVRVGLQQAVQVAIDQRPRVRPFVRDVAVSDLLVEARNDPGLGLPERQICILGMWILRRARDLQSFVAPHGSRIHSSVTRRFCSSLRGGPGGHRRGLREDSTPNWRHRLRSLRNHRGSSPNEPPSARAFRKGVPCPWLDG